MTSPAPDVEHDIEGATPTPVAPGGCGEGTPCRAAFACALASARLRLAASAAIARNAADRFPIHVHVRICMHLELVISPTQTTNHYAWVAAPWRATSVGRSTNSLAPRRWPILASLVIHVHLLSAGVAMVHTRPHRPVRRRCHVRFMVHDKMTRS